MGGLFTATSGRAERLVMRGPGGRGEADVAVSGVRGTDFRGSFLHAIFSLFPNLLKLT